MNTLSNNIIDEVKNYNKETLTKDEIFKIVLECQNKNKTISCGEISLSYDKRTVTVGDDKPITLQNIIFKLLVYMIEREGCVISREEILKNVWGYHFTGERTVDVAICKLRQVVGNKKIISLRKVGYYFENIK
jgi:hypothetical protein